MKPLSSVLILLLAASTSILAQNIAPEELQKQNDFKKMYSTGERTDQLKSIELFEGATHASSRQILTTVVTTSQFSEIRNAAFLRLSQMPATDPGLSLHLANLFRSLKPTDIEGKVEFAKAMKNSEFKYSIHEALTEYGSKLRYPDLYTGPMGGGRTVSPGGNTTGNGGDPNFNNKKQRKEFEDFLGAFNEVVPEAKLKVTDRNSPVEFRKWFELTKSSTLKKDRELAEKYAAEARERANQNNALLIKKKDETGQVAEKKDGESEEKKEDAKKPE